MQYHLGISPASVYKNPSLASFSLSHLKLADLWVITLKASLLDLVVLVKFLSFCYVNSFCYMHCYSSVSVILYV